MSSSGPSSGVEQLAVNDAGTPCRIATHWPHVTDDIPWHIYFRKKPKIYPNVGDQVIFYETVAGRQSRLSRGHGAIVFAAGVKERISRNVYGDFHNWPYTVDCGGHPLEDVREVVSGLFWQHTLTDWTRINAVACGR